MGKRVECHASDTSRISLYLDEKAKSRFWRLVAVTKDDDCWNWIGCKYRKHQLYGQFSIAYKQYLSHRISYFMANGNLPNDKVIRHTCDNAACVNPRHLVAGSIQDNNHDRFVRGRTVSPKGEKHRCAKLTDNDVIEMRSHRQLGLMVKDIAAMYGIRAVSASHAISGRTWKHIPL